MQDLNVKTLVAMLLMVIIIAVTVAGNASSNEQPYVSIYDSPSDATKSVVECAYDNHNDKRLVIKTADLDDDSVVSWVNKYCGKESK